MPNKPKIGYQEHSTFVNNEVKYKIKQIWKTSFDKMAFSGGKNQFMMALQIQNCS